MMRVALVGTGVIGRGWGVVFARSGHHVSLFDATPGAAEAAAEAIETTLAELGSAAGQPLKVCHSMEAALKDTDYVQESVNEDPAAKAAVFKAMDSLAEPRTILASSCSTLPPSSFLQDVAGRARCLVAHPFNPAYLMPLVELVPSRWTSPEVLTRCHELLSVCGQIPVVVRHEIEGYAGNRLQAAVVNEAMYLLAEGVMSAQDLDRTLRWGLGLRWALMGPFQTMDLNADGGIGEYLTKYGAAYQSLGTQLGVQKSWQAHAIEAASRELRERTPLGALPHQRLRRDQRLQALRVLLDSLDAESQEPEDIHHD